MRNIIHVDKCTISVLAGCEMWSLTLREEHKVDLQAGT